MSSIQSKDNNNNNNNLVRSIYKSQDEPIEIKVTGDGTLPKWINGTLFRNGPGRFRFDNKVYQHLFDGLAVVNKFQIKDGKVFFSNKLLETENYKKANEENYLRAMFGTPDLCSSMFQRFKVVFNKVWPVFEQSEFGLDNANVNIVPFAGSQLYALTESNMIARLNPNNLDVVKIERLTDYLKQTNTNTAHPHVLDDGSWLSVGMRWGRPGSYHFTRFNTSKKCEHLVENAELIAQVRSSHMNGTSYFHSFGLTKNYIVFFEQPFVVDLAELGKSLIFSKSFKDCIVKTPNVNTIIHLINYHTGEVVKQKFETKPLFVFHHINAYETNDGQIIADLSAYNFDEFDLNNYNYSETEENLFEKFLLKVKARATRLKIPFQTKNEDENTPIYCQLQDLNDKISFELGTINYGKFNAKPYNYAYGLGSDVSPYSIVKINVNNFNEYLKADLTSGNDYVSASEPVFVENPNGVDEDDGALLSLVLGNKYDYLSVLDAKNLKEICRAELPPDVKSTLSFHGFFADEKNFKDLN